MATRNRTACRTIGQNEVRAGTSSASVPVEQVDQQDGEGGLVEHCTPCQ
ncbi:MAG: hypothetical protein R2708_24090 [Vicinamibacterales bacterium]